MHCSSSIVHSIKIFYTFVKKMKKKMEATFKHFRYIDLSTLTSSGQRKLIGVYKRLLQEFPQKEKSKEPSDFEKEIIELSQINNKKNIHVGKEINIGKLTDDMYDAIL
jgi:oligoribonuclease (3'-5' exoribonuclease)